MMALTCEEANKIQITDGESHQPAKDGFQLFKDQITAVGRARTKECRGSPRLRDWSWRLGSL